MGREKVRLTDLPRTLLLGVVVACDGGLSVDEICDGTADVRLYVADWSGGASNMAVDYVMHAEGMRFLKIDGNCRYFVVDGEAVEYRWWEPVREGALSDMELGEILERLRVDTWASFDEDDLVWPDATHPEWEKFHVADEKYECPYGCPPGGAAREISYEARALISELAEQSEAVVPVSLEVSVIAEPAPESSRLPLIVTWGAAMPLASVLDDPTDVYVSRDPDDIGTFVAAADEPWFVLAREQYLAAVPIAQPSGIGIIDDASGDVAYNLFVRMVVP